MIVLPGYGAHAGGIIDPHTASYDGPIDQENNRRFFAGIAERDVRRLLITSSGGEVEAAIALANWVFERAIDVEVVSYCLSSCANYVFPAARQKTIRTGAVVAWHGNYHHLQHTGLWRDDVELRMERDGEDRATATGKVRAQVQRLVELEREFFTRIGVDQRLCWIGKMPPYSVPDYYFLSVVDMARFGVDQVSAPATYRTTGVSALGWNVQFIVLDHAGD